MKEGKNIGFEQNGKGSNFVRPILVLRKFNSSIFWGLPLTTIKKQVDIIILFLSGRKSIM